jgi:hypothetical protein
MPASINDQDAEIQAIALAWNVCEQSWKLFAVGSLEECHTAVKRDKDVGSEVRFAVYLTDEVFGYETY